jgi:hypothetical protein
LSGRIDIVSLIEHRELNVEENGPASQMLETTGP